MGKIRRLKWPIVSIKGLPVPFKESGRLYVPRGPGKKGIFVVRKDEPKSKPKIVTLEEVAREKAEKARKK